MAIISVYVPGQHMLASAGLGPTPSAPKQWKLDGSVKIYNSVSTDEIQEQKNRETAGI